jgi:sulfur transfer complex TusBCD TusB component (DsrH family)
VDKILCLLTKNPHGGLAFLAPSGSPSDTDLSVVLLQDAVCLQESLGVPTYVLTDDAKARNVTSPFPSVSYRELVEMIFSAHRVVTVGCERRNETIPKKEIGN